MPSGNARRLPLALVALVTIGSVCLLAATLTEPFTETAGTNLTAHTTVTTWAKQTGATGDIVITDINAARGNTDGATAEYQSAFTPASRNYDVDVDYVVKSHVVNHYLWAKGQADATAATYYMGLYDTALDSWRLTKSITGSTTDIGTGCPYAQALTNGVTYHLKLELRASSQKVYIDSVLRCTASDTDITATGLAGLGLYTEGAPTNSTSIHWDNFVVTDVAVSSGGMLLRGVALFFRQPWAA